MTSVKVKFRPFATDGREDSIYYQVIHNRVARQIMDKTYGIKEKNSCSVTIFVIIFTSIGY